MTRCASVEEVLPMTRRTSIDANLLIAPWHGRDDVGLDALAVLDDLNLQTHHDQGFICLLDGLPA